MIKNVHGGDIYSREISLDFSANINPLGTPESIVKAASESLADIKNYPDPNCTLLRNALSEHENIGAGNIVCGNGAADLIYRIVLAVRPKKALITAPTFSEYEKALLTVGCDVGHFMLRESSNFRLDENILGEISGNDMVFICNPNNPVGNAAESGLISEIISECGKCGCIAVIDECFMDFVSGNKKYRTIPKHKNAVILKAFTKMYAMAGLRLGYMLCADEKLCNSVSECGQSWSVSIPAQAAGIAALGEHDIAEETRCLIDAERKYLMDKLSGFGFKVYPSQANFILFRCCLPLDEMLIKEKIAIRNCGGYIGLSEGYFRIAVRTHAENEMLVKAVERIVCHG